MAAAVLVGVACANSCCCFLCCRLCSLAQTTKQEMEDVASLRKSEEAEAASSEEDSGLDVKASNTTEEENDKTSTSGQLF